MNEKEITISKLRGSTGLWTVASQHVISNELVPIIGGGREPMRVIKLQ
jgi:hypothetical protein